MISKNMSDNLEGGMSIAQTNFLIKPQKIDIDKNV